MIKLNTAGTFKGVAHRPETGWIGESSNGTPCVEIVCEVTEDGKCKGQSLTAFLYCSQAALGTPEKPGITARTLRDVFGFNGDFPSLQLGKITFEGVPISFVTEFETYEGDEKLKVKWINTVERKPRIDASAAKTLAERLQRQAGAVFAAMKPMPKVEPKTPPTEGDDVPFE